MEDSHQNKKKICRLCLMKCDEYKIMERNILNNMDVLLLNMNLLLSGGPVVCKNCAEIVKKYFYFKTMCLDTHKYIVSFISDKSSIKIDLKNIYLSKKEYATGILRDCNICGLCMGVVKCCFAISLDNEEDNILQKMFKKCFPDLDFGIIKEPIICAPCHGHLKEYFGFVTNCLRVEDEIMKYCETLHIKTNNTLDLTDVLQFMLRNKVTCGEDVNTADKNKKVCTIHPEHFYEVGEYVNESVTEVEDQKLNNFLQFPLRNISLDIIGKDVSKIELQEKLCDGNENIIEQQEDIKCDPETISIEDYKYDNILFSSRIMCEEVGIIKKEGKFDDGQEVQKNGNCVGVEDQKYLVNDEIEIKTDPLDFSSFQSDSLKLVTSDVIKSRKDSELDHRLLPSEALLRESSGEYRNDARKPESITGGPLEQSECTNPSMGQKLTPKHNSEISIYQCKSSSLQTKYNLAKHSCKVHKLNLKVKMHQCELCPFETKYKHRLKAHSLVHKDPSTVTMYQCGSCSYHTKHKNLLKSHSLVHKDTSEVIIYRCESCPFQTRYKSNLPKHSIKIHKVTLNLSMYRCELCPFETKYKHSLKVHSLVHEDASTVRRYQCNSCPYHTNHKNLLKSHSLVHKDTSEVIIYRCESCPFQTKRKGALNRHSLTHKDPSKVIMYQCETCPYQTKRKDLLKNHSLVHMDPSKVTMTPRESCPDQTKHKDLRESHLLVHNEVIYQCESCPFQTKRKRNLRRHSLVHKDPSNVTIYRCDSCPYQTKHKNLLRSHLVVHKDNSEIMYQCESCPFQTKRKRNLKVHSLIHMNPSTVTMCH